MIIDIGPTLELEGLERTTRLSATRPALFLDRTDIERYRRETSPGYSDEIYAHRLRWLFRRTDAGYVWRSDAAALARILGPSACGHCGAAVSGAVLAHHQNIWWLLVQRAETAQSVYGRRVGRKQDDARSGC